MKKNAKKKHSSLKIPPTLSSKFNRNLIIFCLILLTVGIGWLTSRFARRPQKLELTASSQSEPVNKNPTATAPNPTATAPNPTATLTPQITTTSTPVTPRQTPTSTPTHLPPPSATPTQTPIITPTSTPTPIQKLICVENTTQEQLAKQQYDLNVSKENDRHVSALQYIDNYYGNLGLLQSGTYDAAVANENNLIHPQNLQQISIDYQTALGSIKEICQYE